MTAETSETALGAGLAKYARLLVGRAANVAAGDSVHVFADVEHAALARLIAKECWQAGASEVDVAYVDAALDDARLQLAPHDALGWSPPWLVDRLRWLSARGGINIGLVGGPNPSGNNTTRRARAVQRDLKAEYTRLLNIGSFTRTTAPAATPSWAERVYGTPDTRRLWEAIFTACRLDAADPIVAWDEHMSRLEQRAHLLNEREIDAVRFWGPGTDLVVGLMPDSVWRPVRGRTARGRSQIGNLPTEEVLTTPHRARTEGRARATRPCVLAGSLVEGLELEFASGKIVNVSADVGADVVKAQLATDEGAQRLGEVALVDGSSRVAQLDLVFYNTVLDENATCHIAFGQGYLDAVVDGRLIKRENREPRGINESEVHHDVMIGSPEVEVDGVAVSGEVIPLLRGEQWQLR